MQAGGNLAMDPLPPSETYVSRLPENAVSNVLRFLSSRPRSADWPHHFALSGLRDLANDQHALHSAAQQSLTSLHLHPLHDSSSETDALAAILTAFGRGASSVHFNLSPAHPHAWAASFRSHCTHIRRLDFRSVPAFLHLDALLAPLTHLEDLRLHTLANQHATWAILAEHGAGIARLHVDVARQNSPAMRRALAVLGRTLSSLALCLMGTPETDQPLEELRLSEVGRLCPLIDDLDVAGDCEFARADIQALCVAYGAQLRRLAIPYAGKKPAFLRALADKCPNVRVDTDMKPFNVPLADFLAGAKPDPTPTMEVLGPLLREFTVRFGFPVTNEFRIAAARCSNLARLEVTESVLRGFVDMLRGLFYLPKPELRMLDVAFIQDATLATGAHRFPEIVACIARNCANLQTLGLTIPVLAPEVLANLARSNRRLEYATLRVCFPEAPHPDGGEEARVQFFVQIIRAMNSCKSLKSLVITDNLESGARLAEVENACVCFRFRRISVSVRGVVYLE